MRARDRRHCAGVGDPKARDAANSSSSVARGHFEARVVRPHWNRSARVIARVADSTDPSLEEVGARQDTFRRPEEPSVIAHRRRSRQLDGKLQPFDGTGAVRVVQE